MFASKAYSGPEESFQVALSELAKGNIERAELLLTIFSIQHPTPRVFLELGRAQFLQGKLDKARESFRKAKKNGPSPLAVRKNIDNFLSKIDKEIGFKRYRVELRNDDNPLNFTDTETVQIGMFNFNINQPTQNETVFGLQHSLDLSSGSKGFWGTNISSSITLSDYEKSIHDRLNFFGSVQKQTGLKGIENISVFYSNERSRETKKYQQLGLKLLTPKIAPLRNARFLATLAKADIKTFDYLDANQYQLDLLMPFRVGETIYRLDFAHLQNLTKAKPDRYSANIVRLLANLNSKALKTNFDLRLQFTDKAYKANSPMFGRRRSDEIFFLEARIKPEIAQVRGYQMELGLRLERTESSINYFDVNKFIWSLNYRL